MIWCARARVCVCKRLGFHQIIVILRDIVIFKILLFYYNILKDFLLVLR